MGSSISGAAAQKSASKCKRVSGGVERPCLCVQAEIPCPQAPFHAVNDHAAVTAIMKAGYEPGSLQLLRFWGIDISKGPEAAWAEAMTVPCSVNSGTGKATFAENWMGLFPFVPMASIHVDVDEVFISGDGLKVLAWFRWSGDCTGSFKFPDGSVVDLTGKRFDKARYAYILTFDPVTKKVVHFHGLTDVSEWGRLMGSTAYALTSAVHQIYK